jgi:phospho-N-acetylmuramoyl-pentapeptide-transferase
MLYYIFEYLERNYDLPGASLFQYISFRSGIAVLISLLISMVLGGRIIRSLKRKQVGESVRELGLEGQKIKEGTPTMGGLIILASILIPCLLLAKLDNIYIILMLLATVWMGGIGFVDDYIKVFKKNKKGLEGKFKVIGQIGLGLIIGVTMAVNDDVVVRMPVQDAVAQGYEIVKTFEVTEKTAVGLSLTKEMAYAKASITNIPFFKNNTISYSDFLWFLKDNREKWVWIIFVPIVIFIVTGVSNGANLTDGLDGLLAGLSAIIGATLGIFAYVSGNSITADYLNILYIPHSAELVIYSACFVGACTGFLWHNAYPAKVFMGDTGSLAIGGIVAALAIFLRKELLLPLLCGIFLAETLSVIIQVSYFKYTKKKTGEGKRIFLMSPLHHHYQKKGFHEVSIVTRFWIIGIMLALLSIITLKIR